MKILVAGNIAAGKTTIIKEALEDYPEVKYIAIDEIRERYGDHTDKGEDEARGVFIRDIVLSDHCVIECAGVGKIYSLIKPQLTHMVLVKTSLTNCLKRYNSRGTDAIIPRAWKDNGTIEDSLKHISRCHSVTSYDIVMDGMNSILSVRQFKRFIEAMR